MKTIIISLLIATAILQFGCNKQTQTDLSNYGYKGKVESVKIETFDVQEKFGEISIIGYQMFGENKKYIFSVDGNLTEETKFESNGSISWKKVYSLDKQNKKSAWDMYNNNGNLEAKSISDLDESFNDVKTVRYNAHGNPIVTFTHEYDHKNRLISAVTLMPDADTKSVINYIYNSQDQLIEQNHFKDEIYEMGYKYIYDNNGNLIEEIFYGSNEQKTKEEGDTTFKEYNDKNQLLVSFKKYPDGNIKLKESFIYDATNILIESIWYNNQWRDDVEFEWFTEKSKPAKSTHHYYKYDEIGNKIEDLSYVDNKPVNVIKYTFQYYL